MGLLRIRPAVGVEMGLRGGCLHQCSRLWGLVKSGSVPCFLPVAVVAQERALAVTEVLVEVAQGAPRGTVTTEQLVLDGETQAVVVVRPKAQVPGAVRVVVASSSFVFPRCQVRQRA